MNVTELRHPGLTLKARAGGKLAGQQTVGGDSSDHRPPIISHYLSIVRRRRWIIFGSIAAALLIGLLITLLMTPRYTATAMVEIQREAGNFTNVKGVESTDRSAIDLEFYQTQYGLLEARSLADRVVTDLRLFDNAGFFEMFGSDRATQWFENGRVRNAQAGRDQRIREAGDILLDNFEVTPERMSRLVTISFTSPDAVFSRRVVDAWGAHFIQATLERRFEATSYARRFLEERLVQLRARIEESERALVDYAARNGIVNLPATTPTQGEGGVIGERSLVADDLATLNRELGRATADRVQAQSRAGAQGDVVTEGLENPAIGRLRERRAELAADHARMMVQFEREYPPAIALQTQIEQLDRSISREEARVRSTLRQTYQASLDREQDLRGRVGALKSGLLDLRRRSIQYNIYQREVDTNRQLYDALLQRYKEIGVAGGVGVNNISVVDVAEVPDKPSSPRFLLNMIIALFAGTVIGVGLAFALEQIDEGIADPAEVEDRLGVALLGTVPRAPDGDPIGALQDRKSSLSEAYLSLQTNLALATDHGVPRTLAVTSSSPGEGKTTTSYALAQFLARSGRRSLIVDADMRSSSVHHLFGLKNDRGLSNYLSGDDDLDKMIRATSIEGLFVLTGGPQPPSAAELLSSDRLGRMYSKLLEKFDHIVVDAPPVMGLADAPLIGNSVEAIVFVIESHRTKKSIARVAIGRLAAASSQILGAVLTKFDTKRAHYGYGYDYGYEYGYGESAKSES